MPSLSYVGPEPDDTEPKGVQNRSQSETQLNSGVTREFVDGRVITLADIYASKSYIDTQDGLYADAAYYQDQDALLVPISSKGQPNGVASLDSSGKIPSAQVPDKGSGTIKGRYGLTATFTGTTETTPLKIAEIHLGVTGVNFKALAFLTALLSATNGGRPVVELRIGDSTQTTFASQTLVADGFGRARWEDLWPVVVRPSPNALNVMQDGVQTYYGPNTDYMLTAWAYEITGSGQITIASGGIVSASAWLLRVVQ